jgi:hypothetical protein
MKILYIFKQEPDETAKTFLKIHSYEHMVTVVNLEQEKDYNHIVELIENNDRVISW